MISYNAILNKAKSYGFDTIQKMDQIFKDNSDKIWTIWIASNSKDEYAIGLPFILLTSNNKIRRASYSETMKIL